MSETHFYESGFDGLENLLYEFSEKMENPLDIIEDVAKELVSDIRKLPKPRSMINKPGYTHLLDTVTYERTDTEIEVGWGKYYGPMVEYGTKNMDGVPHISTTFEANKEKYYRKMKEKLYGGF